MASLSEAGKTLSKALSLTREGRTAEAAPVLNEAETLLKACLQETPNSAQVHFWYARLLETRQRYDAAEEHYQTARRLDPLDGAISDAYEHLQRRRQSLGSAASAQATPPPAEAAAGPAPGAVHATVSPPPPPASAPTPPPIRAADDGRHEAEMWWALGDLRLSQGDEEGAEEAFQTALDKAPNYAPALEAYATLLLNQGRYDEAEEPLAQLADSDPAAWRRCFASPSTANADVLTLEAAILRRQGNLADAMPLLEQALTLEPDREDRLVSYAQALLEMDQVGPATQKLEEALGAGMTGTAVRREYVRGLARQKRYDEVERQLKLLRQAGPEDEETLKLGDELQSELETYQLAYRTMALAQVKARAPETREQAERLFEKALEIDPQHLPTLKAYATYLKDQGRLSEAVRMWALAAPMAPREAEGELEAILDAQDASSQTLNTLAQVLVQLGREDDAEQRLRRSLALEGDNPTTLQLLTDVLVSQGRPDEAEALLRDRRAVVEGSGALSLRYAQLLAGRGDYEKAGRAFRRARDLEPSDEAIRQACDEAEVRLQRFNDALLEMALGRKAEREGNYPEAEDAYRKALAIDPDHVPTLSRFAQLLERQGRPMEAGHYLAHLSRIDPGSVETHYQQRPPHVAASVEGRAAYGRFLQEQGRTEDALAQYGEALAQQPDYALALNPYLDLLLQAGQTREAEGALKRALVLAADNAPLNWRYGELLAGRHRYDLAEPYLKRAVDLEPDNADFQASHAKIQEPLRLIQEAELAWATALVKPEPADKEALFREALDVYPEHVPSLRDYGDWLAQAGRHADAVVQWQRAAALDPDDPALAARLAPPTQSAGGEAAGNGRHEAEETALAAPTAEAAVVDNLVDSSVGASRY